MEDPEPSVRRATPDTSLRLDRVDGRTEMDVHFQELGDHECRVAVQHRRLEGADEVTRRKDSWKRQLAAFAESPAQPEALGGEPSLPRLPPTGHSLRLRRHLPLDAVRRAGPAMAGRRIRRAHGLSIPSEGLEDIAAYPVRQRLETPGDPRGRGAPYNVACPLLGARAPPRFRPRRLDPSRRSPASTWRSR